MRSFWLADPAPGVEERVDREEFEKIMQECLQSLTPVYRDHAGIGRYRRVEL